MPGNDEAIMSEDGDAIMSDKDDPVTSEEDSAGTSKEGEAHTSGVESAVMSQDDDEASQDDFILRTRSRSQEISAKRRLRRRSGSVCSSGLYGLCGLKRAFTARGSNGIDLETMSLPFKAPEVPTARCLERGGRCTSRKRTLNRYLGSRLNAKIDCRASEKRTLN